MKFLPLILILLCGCKALDKKIIQDSQVSRPIATARSLAQPSVTGLQVYNCHWPPGDYTNFVVITATELPAIEWSTWLETDLTNFQFIVDSPMRFFQVYGTNKVTGENAWAGQQ